MTCADYLLGIFHQKLIPRFLEQARIRMHTLVQELSETQFKSLVQAVKRNVVLIDTTNGFDNAQVCAGGISTIELSARTMESRYIKAGILQANFWMQMESAVVIIFNGHGQPAIWPAKQLRIRSDFYKDNKKE